MMASPLTSWGASRSSVWSTTAAGTISQTARGGFRRATKSSSEEEPVAFSFARASTAFGL
jgi:hypothetical protein